MPTQHIDLSRAVWQKSSHSGGNGGQCVEVARNLPGIVAVRDSKAPDGTRLLFGANVWRTFAAALKEGMNVKG